MSFCLPKLSECSSFEVLLQKAERNAGFLVIVPNVRCVRAILLTVITTLVKFRFSIANGIKG